MLLTLTTVPNKRKAMHAQTIRNKPFKGVSEYKDITPFGPVCRRFGSACWLNRVGCSAPSIPRNVDQLLRNYTASHPVRQGERERERDSEISQARQCCTAAVRGGRRTHRRAPCLIALPSVLFRSADLRSCQPCGRCDHSGVVVAGHGSDDWDFT
jgi:hypothetical protein